MRVIYISDIVSFAELEGVSRRPRTHNSGPAITWSQRQSRDDPCIKTFNTGNAQVFTIIAFAM